MNSLAVATVPVFIKVVTIAQVFVTLTSDETVAIKVVDMRMLEDRLHQELLQS